MRRREKLFGKAAWDGPDPPGGQGHCLVFPSPHLGLTWAEVKSLSHCPVEGLGAGALLPSPFTDENGC